MGFSITSAPGFHINLATPGFLELMEQHPKEVHLMVQEAARAAKERKGDWMYAVALHNGVAEELGHDKSAPENAMKVYFCQNETGSYTALLPSEY